MITPNYDGISLHLKSGQLNTIHRNTRSSTTEWNELRVLKWIQCNWSVGLYVSYSLTSVPKNWPWLGNYSLKTRFFQTEVLTKLWREHSMLQNQFLISSFSKTQSNRNRGQTVYRFYLLCKEVCAWCSRLNHHPVLRWPLRPDIAIFMQMSYRQLSYDYFLYYELAC